MWSLHGFLHGIEWIMFHGHLDYFQKPSLGGRPNTKPGDHGTPNAHNCWFIIFYHAWGPTWIEIHRKYLIEGPITYDFTLHLRVHDHTYMILEVSWDGLGTLSFGLSQFHGYGSWLMCEVALSIEVHRHRLFRSKLHQIWWFPDNTGLHRLEHN